MPDNTIRDQLAADVVTALDDNLVPYCCDDHPKVLEGALDADTVADRLLAAGWRPPARILKTAEAIADEPTGVVIRSRHGDIGSVDHGPRGEWQGHDTVVHFLNLTGGPRATVADLLPDAEVCCIPWTVLWQPEVSTDV